LWELNKKHETFAKKQGAWIDSYTEDTCTIVERNENRWCAAQDALGNNRTAVVCCRGAGEEAAAIYPDHDGKLGSRIDCKIGLRTQNVEREAVLRKGRDICGLGLPVSARLAKHKLPTHRLQASGTVLRGIEFARR
jgi:hypothetical protein